MRDYGKVHSSFWSSHTIRDMSEDGRQLALYLLTSPHGTISGVFRLPDGYICEDLQWTAERVNLTLAELLTKGFANRCGTTKWVWIFKHFEWNKPENPNQRKSAKKIALSIPDSCSWKPLFMQYWAGFLDISPEEIGTLSKPLANPCLTNSSNNNNNNNSNSNSNSNTLPLTREDDFKVPLTPEHDLIRFVDDDDDLLTDQADNSGNPMSDNSGLHHVANSHTQAAHSCTGEHLQFDSQFLLMARTTGLESHYTDENIQDIFNLFRCYKTNAHTLKSHADWLGLWRTWCQREKTRYAKSKQQPQSPAGSRHGQPSGRSESNTQRALRIAQQSAEKLAGSENPDGY